MSDTQSRFNPSDGNTPSDATGHYDPTGKTTELFQILDQYLFDLKEGKAPDQAELLARYPDIANELKECLAGIEFVHKAAKPDKNAPTQLGDFRIIREVGRGGMGVVYEADQLSLKRKVALKVLRFGIGTDADVMARFQREAETVAHLHHTNIVPIHAIGCDQGVHFYAMQFIEGKSLAAVISERAATNTPFSKDPDHRQVAGWALQAADALAHSHQRGVIHRDIKPSNLILDAQGTVWLTDFGLAKRSEEVTLTLAGVLMGTPRYMSPEQATATTNLVDHRTDIYSLGATLYELATGKPVFDAQSPQALITQILHSDPPAPRSVNPSVPRDLETIILKCLSKDPKRRYSQAREMADDLRSFLENRLIRARRPSMVEKTGRWFQKNRRMAIVSVATMIASLVFLGVGLSGWFLYRDSRMGKLSFTTDGPTLIAEIFDHQDRLVIPRFPVPNNNPIKIPEGEYLVRFSGTGLLSEDWTVSLEPGQYKTHPVRLWDRNIAPPFDLRGNELPQLVHLNGRSFLLTKGDRAWRLLDGETKNPAWSVDLGMSPSQPPFTQLVWDCPDKNRLDILQAVGAWQTGNATGSAPGVTAQGTDIDGDGIDDLILGSRVSSTLIAVSGKDGKGLWFHWARPDLLQSFDPTKDPIDFDKSRHEAGMIGQPLFVKHREETLVISMVISFASQIQSKGGKAFSTQREIFLEAVSGKTGNFRWRAKIHLPQTLLQEFVGQLVRKFPTVPEIVTHEKRSVVALAVESLILGFDLETGKPSWTPFSLKEPFQDKPYFADLNGDGKLDALLVTEKTHYSEELILRATSLADGKDLWVYGFRSPKNLRFTTGPVDQKQILIAPSKDPSAPLIVIPVKDDWTQFKNHWFGIESIDAKSGQLLWQKKLKLTGPFAGGGIGVSMGMIDGPDRDGDGLPDLFICTSQHHIPGRVQESTALSVESISSKTGSFLWRTAIPTGDPSWQKTEIPLKWGQKGKDGWPQLILSFPQGTGGQLQTLMISSGNGKVLHTLNEVTDPQVADLNNDGIPDLYFTSGPQGNRRFSALRGRPPQEWSRPDDWKPAEDFNGDGILDFLNLQNQIQARSGRDGKVLWQTSARVLMNMYVFCDVNGDNTPDLIIPEFLVTMAGNQGCLSAYSGKYGKKIWSVIPNDFTGGISTSAGGGPRTDYRYPFLETVILDPAQGPVVILVSRNSKKEYQLQTFSAKDGIVLWSVPIEERAYLGHNSIDRHLLYDLNGDGCKDLVVWCPVAATGTTEKTRELQAISGRDGSVLWKGPNSPWSKQDYFWPRPAVADLNGDGTPEVVYTIRDGNGFHTDKKGYPCEMVVLDGKTGQQKWNFPWIAAGTEIWPPLLVDWKGDGNRVICLGIDSPNHPKPTRIIVFRPNGEQMMIVSQDPLTRDPLSLGKLSWSNPRGQWIETNPGWLHMGNRSWGVASQGNQGMEALVYHNGSGVTALSLQEKKPIWYWPIRGMWGALSPGKPASAQTWNLLDDQTLTGFDPVTGMGKVKTEIPGQVLTISSPTWVVDKDSPASKKVFVAEEASRQTSLIHTWPVDATGKYQSDRVPLTIYPDSVDQGFIRGLPWLRPLGFQRHPLEPDSWELTGFLDPVEVTLRPIFLTLFFLGLLWGAIYGKWKTSIILFGIWMIVTGVSAFVMIHFDSQSKSPEETYSWFGWYWIFLLTAEKLGFFVLIGWIVLSLLKFMRNSRGKRARVS